MSAGLARRWAPPLILAIGVFLLTFVRAQLAPQLRKPLVSALPAKVAGMPGQDVGIADDEAVAAGFTDYALRVYQAEDTTESEADTAAAAAADAAAEPAARWASVYLGFYDQQSRGQTIHSPQNCLPGSGWNAISSKPAELGSGNDSFVANRYLLQNKDQRALVLYWYQGRGRVAHDEYLVKWQLLRDAALRRRTDEALVRIVVPIGPDDEERAFSVARDVALRVRPALDEALPAW